MKNRYFLVVVFTVVCTVWSEADSLDCNNTEELIKCFSPTEAVTNEIEFGFFFREEELKIMCPNLNQGLQCVDSYARRCMTEEMRHRFQRLYSGVTQVFKKLCHPGPYQDEYLTHVPCLRQVNDDLEHCARTHDQRNKDVRVKMKEQDMKPTNQMSPENDSELRAACCSLRDYMACNHKIVLEKCGEQTAKFMDDTQNEMSFSLIKGHCGIYDQCQGSSASRDSPRALLFSVSLAMMLLYALRPT